MREVLRVNQTDVRISAAAVCCKACDGGEPWQRPCVDIEVEILAYASDCTDLHTSAVFASTLLSHYSLSLPQLSSCADWIVYPMIVQLIEARTFEVPGRRI